MKNSHGNDLVSVRSSFRRWRERRSHREPIPELLWQRALALIESYSPAAICRELKLNPARFKQRLVAAAPSHPNARHAPASFVEVRGSDLSSHARSNSPCSPIVGSSSCMRLVVERPDGLRLSFELPAADHSSLQALCSALLHS